MHEKPLKADLHTHCGSDPNDRLPYSPEDLIDEMAGRGFDDLAITNHNCQDFCRRLYEYARDPGVLLIKGMELDYEGQHVLLINFDHPEDIYGPDDILKHKRPDNLVIAAHPYFPLSPGCGDLLDTRPEIFDVVEYAHLYVRAVNFNDRAVERARCLGLPMVGTSDAHSFRQIGHT